MSWFLLLIVAAGADDAAALLEKAVRSAQSGKYSAADATWRALVDRFPGSPEADVARERLQANAYLRVVDLKVHGEPDNRIDLFILAEGYLRETKYQRQFDGAAKGTLKYFQQAPVYKRYFPYFNFYAMNIASAEDGVDNDRKQFDTALGAHESGGTQGQVAVSHGQVMEFLRHDPRSEGLAVVIVRLGTLGTGGGGVAAVGGGPSNTVIHEWGHAFGRLLDEYTSDVGYTGAAPRGYNVTNTESLVDVPWRHWIDAKQEGVGLFPGAAGRSQGAWRATASGCAMNRGPSYCLVCREAVLAHIYERVSPIDDATDEGPLVVVRDGADAVLDVVPMRVASAPHLEVTFTIEPSQERFDVAAEAGGGSTGSPFDPAADEFDNPFLVGGDPVGATYPLGGHRSRFGKPADPPPPGDRLRPKKVKLADKRVAHRVTLRASDLDAGSYRVHARVVDPTPWLIKEEWLPLLSDARTWRVVVE